MIEQPGFINYSITSTNIRICYLKLFTYLPDLNSLQQVLQTVSVPPTLMNAWKSKLVLQ
jgi:hypothetical protein